MGCGELTRDQLVRELRKRVVEWERGHWVPYPWRVERTPYKVLIAELLLKRTTRQAVAKEFPKFIKRFPDFDSVFNAPIEEVEEAFRHLGLYKQRAKQLKQLAEAIISRHGGRIPDKWDDLVALPGVGTYLAGAVLSFGYGVRAPVLDSNVIRLLKRLTGTQARRPEDYLPLLWALIPEEGHDLFNYGLIDLGALVCHYRAPRCGQCPLRDLCVTYNQQRDPERARCLKEVFAGLMKK